jgi:hypothetical protein
VGPLKRISYRNGTGEEEVLLGEWNIDEDIFQGLIGMMILEEDRVLMVAGTMKLIFLP